MQKTSSVPTEEQHRIAVLVEMYAIEKCCVTAAQLAGDHDRARAARLRAREARRALVAAGVPL